jgi:hypothetical protein
MPSARLIDIPARRRRKGSEALERERTQIRDVLQHAEAAGRVIELTLADEERAETVKLHYREVARDLGYAIRFQTGRQRTYRTRRGKEKQEGAVVFVFVVGRAPAPGAGQPRRRRKAQVA